MSKNKKTKTKEIEGIIFITRSGLGFVSSDKFEKDIRISRDKLNTALHGDRVKVSLYPKFSNEIPTGKIADVLSRAKEKFVGVVERKDGEYYVRPDDTRMYANIYISKDKRKELTPGTKVVVKITSWKNPKKEPFGKILNVLGEKGVHDTEMHAIVIEHGFETNFPKKVLESAEGLTKEISDSVIKERRDMRGVATFTIDPASAKDFDDALSFQKHENGDIEVGIHIADVTHYVKTGDVIDKEAQKRGTSVYLVDRTIPMLPEKLSNDICSLNANEDRLAFSAIFTFAPNFSVLKRWFGETVIHSDMRFTYENAQEILDAKEGKFADELLTVNKIAYKLRAERFKKGAIDFEQDEVEFELDRNGKPLKIYKKARQDTNKLVEEFMLLANREVAEYIYKLCKARGKNHVFVYRIHDDPDPDKLEELNIFLKALGYDLNADGGDITALDINTMFKQIEGKPEENLIKTATIRSMAKAVYSIKNVGHFGLSFKHYTHFTSPIRRYPDIMVHRILKRHFDDKPILENEFSQYGTLSIEASAREIEAVRAERDSIKYKQVEYMTEHIGEEFDGVISGVTDWGVYVEENNTKAEGLVRVSNMHDDYYVRDEKKYALIGEKTKRKLALGDSVRVKLTDADLDSRTIDFELLEKK